MLSATLILGLFLIICSVFVLALLLAILATQSSCQEIEVRENANARVTPDKELDVV